jgi:hypothetical protein
VINELVLVHIDNKPAFYARVEAIDPDVKPGWWQVKLLVLTIPLQLYTWILDDTQVAGAPFTMGGTPVRLEKVISPVVRSPEPPAEPEPVVVELVKSQTTGSGSGKVVSLADRKKKE